MMHFVLHYLDDALAEAPPAALPQRAAPLKISEVSVEGGGEGVDPFCLRGHGGQYRRGPLLAVGVPSRVARGLGRIGDVLEVDAVVRRHVPERLPKAEPEHQLHLVTKALGARAVGLVDYEDVGDLHEAGLERLDRVARLGDEHDDARVRRARHVELALPNADGLDDHAVEAEGVQDVGDFARRRGETA
jgi:hypothetical protein